MIWFKNRLTILPTYVTNGCSQASNEVTRCEVLANGNLSSCNNSGTALTKNPLVHPLGVRDSISLNQ